MKITLKLFATLRDYGENISEIEVSDNAIPLDVIKLMAIPVEDVSIIMVNGRRLMESVQLNEGDVLALFPPVGGG
jgi:sulfur carrier protein